MINFRATILFLKPATSISLTSITCFTRLFVFYQNSILCETILHPSLCDLHPSYTKNFEISFFFYIRCNSFLHCKNFISTSYRWHAYFSITSQYFLIQQKTWKPRHWMQGNIVPRTDNPSKVCILIYSGWTIDYISHATQPQNSATIVLGKLERHNIETFCQRKIVVTNAQTTKFVLGCRIYLYCLNNLNHMHWVEFLLRIQICSETESRIFKHLYATNTSLYHLLVVKVYNGENKESCHLQLYKKQIWLELTQSFLFSNKDDMFR